MSKETVVVELSRTDRSLLTKLAKAYENPVARFYSDPVNVAKTITEPQVTYPYLSGDVSVIAPGIIMSLDGQVINYKVLTTMHPTRRHRRTESNMTMYRKKPVVVEAKLFTGVPLDTVDILNWGKEGNILWHAGVSNEWITIGTLEGEMTASLGDYIIKGVSGEFYPCKPDIFEKTYEVA